MIVDIAIALDCTGSMQAWIDAAKQQVRNILRDLAAEHPGATFRMAAVLYRDFGDHHTDFDQFRVIPFTEDITDFQRQIQDVQARGGDDEAEDVAGAFRHLNNLVWTGDVRVLFHITDAPPHGSRYHEITTGDRFPNNDPAGNTLDIEVHTLAMNRVGLVVVKANNSVDTMIREFANIYSRVPGSMFRVENLAGQPAPTTPPRGLVDMLEPPRLLRRRARGDGVDTPEMRTITHMVSTAVSEAISSWSTPDREDVHS